MINVDPDQTAAVSRLTVNSPAVAAAGERSLRCLYPGEAQQKGQPGQSDEFSFSWDPSVSRTVSVLLWWWMGGASVPAVKPPRWDVSSGDERPVDTTTSNDRGKGRPVSILQGFTRDEGKSVKTGAAETRQSELYRDQLRLKLNLY